MRRPGSGECRLAGRPCGTGPTAPAPATRVDPPGRTRSRPAPTRIPYPAVPAGDLGGHALPGGEPQKSARAPAGVVDGRVSLGLLRPSSPGYAVGLGPLRAAVGAVLRFRLAFWDDAPVGSAMCLQAAWVMSRPGPAYAELFTWRAPPAMSMSPMERPAQGFGLVVIRGVAGPDCFAPILHGHGRMRPAASSAATSSGPASSVSPSDDPGSAGRLYGPLRIFRTAACSARGCHRGSAGGGCPGPRPSTRLPSAWPGLPSRAARVPDRLRINRARPVRVQRVVAHAAAAQSLCISTHRSTWSRSKRSTLLRRPGGARLIAGGPQFSAMKSIRVCRPILSRAAVSSTVSSTLPSKSPLGLCHVRHPNPVVARQDDYPRAREPYVNPCPTMPVGVPDPGAGLDPRDQHFDLRTQNSHAAASGWAHSCTIRAFPRLL